MAFSVKPMMPWLKVGEFCTCVRLKSSIAPLLVSAGFRGLNITDTLIGFEQSGTVNCGNESESGAQ